MYIEAILQAKIKPEEVARVINEINKILETDYPHAEIIQARPQVKQNYTVIESENDDWEEIVWKRRKYNGKIK